MGGPTADTRPVVPVFFLSDSTGISAETMGNALLIQFPDAALRTADLIPFISTVEEARAVVEVLDEAMDGPVTPLVFTTTAVDEIRGGAARRPAARSSTSSTSTWTGSSGSWGRGALRMAGPAARRR